MREREREREREKERESEERERKGGSEGVLAEHLNCVISPFLCDACDHGQSAYGEHRHYAEIHTNPDLSLLACQTLFCYRLNKRKNSN